MVELEVINIDLNLTVWLSPRVEMGRAVVRERVSHVCCHLGFVCFYARVIIILAY